MKQIEKEKPRVVGFDCHPDSFTAVILAGETPRQAITEKLFNEVPIQQLRSWARKHTTEQDMIVLEASGNSFEVVRTLASVNRRAEVLESCHLGKMKEAHANNDKISAVRIGKAYLAGTTKRVWVPDPKTQERRDWFHAHRKSVKRATQVRNRLLSYLSDNGVRLPSGLELTRQAEAEKQLRSARGWSSRQWTVIEGLLMELRHADEQRRHWRSLMAREVLNDPLLLSLVRLCGVRDIIAFSLGAVIGDITRFASPKKLVKYIGLNPAFDNSGKGLWSGGIGGHGHKHLRSLMVEAGQSLLRSSHPMAAWGKRLLARTSKKKLVVAALARKLTVAVWYLMMGRWTQLEEIDRRLSQKIGTIITGMGAEKIKTEGTTRAAIRIQAVNSLKTQRVYMLDPTRTFDSQRTSLGDPVPQTS